MKSENDGEDVAFSTTKASEARIKSPPPTSFTHFHAAQIYVSLLRFLLSGNSADKLNLRTTRVALEKRRTIRIVRGRERASLREFSMRWLANQSQGNCHARSEHEGFLVAQNSRSNIVYDTDDGAQGDPSYRYTRASMYFLMRAIRAAPACLL